MNKLSRNVLVAGMSLAFLVGCAEKETTETTDSNTVDTTYLAASEPAGAVGVGEARSSAKDQDEVVLTGRIGGRKEPFVGGVAAFTIVDPQVPYCAPDEGCPTPWDYCCTQNQVKENIALVKIVDKDGNPVSKDAGPLLGVKPLDVVVVQGKAKRDEEGNLSVLANRVFVKN